MFADFKEHVIIAVKIKCDLRVENKITNYSVCVEQT